MKLQTRADKLKYLKGLLTGQRSIREFAEPKCIVLWEKLDSGEPKQFEYNDGKLWTQEDINRYEIENPRECNLNCAI